MPSLFNLLEELLLEIFFLFQFSNQTLLSLILVCRRFHRIARPLLYRHISLVNNYINGIYKKPGDERIKQERLLEDARAKQNRYLELAFATHPKLRHAVRRYGPIRLPTEWAKLYLSFAKLRTFPNVHTMTIERPALGFHATATHHWDAQKCAPLHNIKTVRVIAGLTWPDVLAATSWPGVEKVVITGARVPFRLPDAAEYVVEPSTLQTLALYAAKNTGRADSLYEPEILRDILRRCPLTRNLTCHLPVAVQPAGNSYIFRPELVAFALDPIRSTLTKLDLYVCARKSLEFYGKPMDLSRFVSLKVLRIDAVYMVPEQALSADTNVCRLLPHSLERLQVNFYSEQHIFFPPSEPNKEVPDEQYIWLHQFPFHKSSALPHLKEVAMSEVWYVEAQADEYYAVRQVPTRPWKQPPQIRAAFASAKIALNVQIHMKSMDDIWDDAPPERKVKLLHGGRSSDDWDSSW
ncbi:hypothetical protein BDV95DRAFT_603969 [Massariosphaeria phaeospora]|uniref:F-box domain-containing protein n=1 Tax=Massariosphaeria phaeospora TaxID=100035 RepID=A0A7C8IBB8_9PLEO|nr:hypothetical protein BDV95DRAFT_603969 [Massariosphaeria phaeospora]